MKTINIGTVILHSRPHSENFYIVGSAGDGSFVLINLVHGTRASSPTSYDFPLDLRDVGKHMGTLLEKDSELHVLKDCVLSFAITPTAPPKGTVAIGRGE